MRNEEIVKIASEKLVSNNDWREAYTRYAEGISAKKDLFVEVIKILKKKLPRNMGLLRVYSSINLAQKTSVEYDLRIFGQSVGSLIIHFDKNNEPQLFLKITPEQEYNNDNHLGIKTKASPKRKPYPWDSEEAKHIVDIFTKYNGENANMHSDEHKMETLILHDLNKKLKKEGKMFPYVRPVMLGEVGYFQMRTPFGASKHRTKDYPKYCMRKDGAASGGGIDILARIQHKDSSWRLAIIELKDGNTGSESQPIVMQQALVYATFIAHLLRCEECGNMWYNIFRNQWNEVLLNEKKDRIKIDVITMMPPIPLNKHGEYIYNEGELKAIDVPGIKGVTLYPYTVYIDADLKKSLIKNITGTLNNDKKE